MFAVESVVRFHQVNAPRLHMAATHHPLLLLTRSHLCCSDSGHPPWLAAAAAWTCVTSLIEERPHAQDRSIGLGASVKVSPTPIGGEASGGQSTCRTPLDVEWQIAALRLRRAFPRQPDGLDRALLPTPASMAAFAATPREKKKTPNARDRATTGVGISPASFGSGFGRTQRYEPTRLRGAGSTQSSAPEPGPARRARVGPFRLGPRADHGRFPPAARSAQACSTFGSVCVAIPCGLGGAGRTTWWLAAHRNHTHTPAPSSPPLVEAEESTATTA